MSSSCFNDAKSLKNYNSATYGTLPQSVVELKKGHVIQIHSEKKNNKFKETADVINNVYFDNKLITKCLIYLRTTVISKIIKDYNSKKLNISRDYLLIKNFIDENVTIKFPYENSDAVVPHTSVTSELRPASPCVSDNVVPHTSSPVLQSPSVTEDFINSSPAKRKTLFSISTDTPVKRLRKDCEKCPSSRKTLEKSEKTWQKKERQFKTHIRKLKSELSSTFYLKRTINSKKAIETGLRKKVSDLKKELSKKSKLVSKLQVKLKKFEDDENNKILHNLRKAHKKILTEKRKLASSITESLKKKDQEIKLLKKDLDNISQRCEYLLDELNDFRSDKEILSVIYAKENKKEYNYCYRKAAFACLVNQVPVDAVGNVIQSVLKNIASVQISHNASGKTVAQFAYELGALSEIQICETLLDDENENVTIGWDATSLDGAHVNEVHGCVKKNPGNQNLDGLVLQVAELPGGKTADYVKHITECIRDSIESYCICYGVNDHWVFEQIRRRLKNTISDRVNVNHCVVEALQVKLDTELLELNCNLHPLDGIANHLRDILKSEVDVRYNIESICYGSSCRVVNTILALTKMRFKQKCGDPSGFKLFIRREDIPYGMIVRYVGNRFHVLFHLAGVYFHLREKVLSYLEMLCTGNVKLRNALIGDMKNESIHLHLQVLGLIGKIVTGPWMTLVYGNKCNLTNLEFGTYAKTCVISLKSLKDNPIEMFSQSKDVFGNELNCDDVLKSLRVQLDGKTDEYIFVIRTLLEGTIEVVERQLGDYISGPLSNPSAETLVQTESAPMHNMYSERVMGHVDHQHKRAPNATYGFIDGKVKAIKNKTLSWLDSKSLTDQKCLVRYSIKRGDNIRTVRKLRDETCTIEKQNRLTIKCHKFDAQQRNRIQKQMARVVFKEVTLEDAFSSVDSETLTILRSVANHPESLVDRYIHHNWFEKDQNKLYFGKITEMNLKKRQRNKVYIKLEEYTICYWDESESENVGVDFDISLTEVLSDIYTGDFTLL